MEARKRIIPVPNRESFLELLADFKRLFGEGKFVLTRRDIRTLVDLYYEVQEYRKATANQIRSAEDEPCALITWIHDVIYALEPSIQRALAQWVKSDPLSSWASQFLGIGPVLAAGLAANIDIDQCPHVSSLWRFAGFDPSRKWIGKEGAKKLLKEIKESGIKDIEKVIAIAATKTNEKPAKLRVRALKFGKGKITLASIEKALAFKPFNAKLKTLCWKIGKSFVWNKSREGRIVGEPASFYALKYLEAKAEYVGLNETGAYTNDASTILDSGRKFSSAQKKTYKEGKLPAGQIDLRAMRKAVKLFLSHYWEAAYRIRFGKDPEKPWAVVHEGHTYIPSSDAIAYERLHKKEAENADEANES